MKSADEHLLDRLHKGDRVAQRELYDRYAGAALATAMRLVADADSARDIVQDAFVKILTHVDRFEYRGEGTLRAWVLRVVSNEAVTWLRRRRRLLPLTAGREPEAVDVPDEEPDVGSVPMETLQAMISQLPDGYRTVFCLYVFDRLSHREIARQLGIREDSSASQFHRAKRHLAKMISDYKRRQI
ncbi:MAG: RNA polymerase sigma factor [Prevotella sp.]|nr:RNA polymerase sigma factor [Prevotella sp.]